MCCWPIVEFAFTDATSAVGLLVRRLSEVQDLLSALPNDAFVERSALVAEREELQLLAAQHASGADRERSIEDCGASSRHRGVSGSGTDPFSSRPARPAVRISHLTDSMHEREAATGRI